MPDTNYYSLHGEADAIAKTSTLSTFKPGGVVSAGAELETTTLLSGLSSLQPVAPARPRIATEPPLPSVSHHPQTISPTVANLRDRLLNEARSERQRCLAVAEAADFRHTESRGLAHASTQTEPLHADDVLNVTGARRPLALCDETVAPPRSDRDDDREQMEALNALAKLNATQESLHDIKEAHVSELSKQVHSERRHSEEVKGQLAVALSTKQHTLNQVICLEAELDNRECVLQATEEALERRTAELEKAELRIRMLEESQGLAGYSFSGANDSAQCRQLRSQLQDKDRYISRLHALLRTRGIYLEDDATTCGSGVSTATSITPCSLSNFSFMHTNSM